ncbi:MAG: hypothetical protein PHV34_05165 [Verrucomicrobiae bacterium]|nr:hypothetical protein [Verrucomicrobiae bacterium]
MKTTEGEPQPSDFYRYTFYLPPSATGCRISEKSLVDEMDPTRPPPDMALVALSSFGAPGQYQTLGCVIYAQRDLKNVRAEVSDLAMGSAKISRKMMEIRYGMRIAKRKRYSFPPSQNLVTTYFLRTFNCLDIPENHFREIYFTLKIPEDALAGIYQGKINISAENMESSSIGLSMEVFPFKLRLAPDKKYGMYYNLTVKGKFKEKDAIAREIQDLTEHDIQCIYDAGLRPEHRLDTDGNIVSDFEKIEQSLQILRENHFRGMVIMDPGLLKLAELAGKARHGVAAKLPADEAGKKRFAENILGDAFFLKTAKNAMAHLKAIQKKYPELELTLTQLDEVFNDGRLPVYVALTKAAKQVDGFKYYITFHMLNEKADGMRKEMAPHVDIGCLHMYSWEWWLARGHTAEEYRGELKKNHSLAAAYYNPVGVYYTAKWYRLIMGLENWQSPFAWHLPWKYDSKKGDPFNDLDGAMGDHIFGFYSKEDESLVSTRIWEGFREGVTDLKYIHTLEELIKEKKPGEAVRKAQAYLEQIRGKLAVPSNLPHDDPKWIGTRRECPYTAAMADQFSAEDLQNIRCLIARRIEELLK